MQYPIVKIRTTDNQVHHGLFLKPENSDQIYIHIHGTAGNFYNDDFIETMANTLVAKGIAFLATNNRGTGVYDMYSRTGAAVEIFEDCLLDIDAWIIFAINKGYKKIILSGHSLGAEKIVYYMQHGTLKDKIAKLVLLAPADSPRWRIYDDNYALSEKGRENLDTMIREAKMKIQEGQENILMDVDIKNGFMPRTPVSLLNILGENTELISTLPFHAGKLEMFRKIQIPICVIIGNQREYTGISPENALALMHSENSLAETHLLKDADHDFTNKEDELAEIVLGFVLK